jgi:hypothetical protein
MRLFSSLAATRKVVFPLLALMALSLLAPYPGNANDSGPFAGLAGWWAGEGRLSFKDGKLEQVKCRATYFVSEDKEGLKQNIRCASGSGKIEVTSSLKHDTGKLSGSWSELNYDMTGDLNGEVTPKGYRIQIKGTGTDLSANMEVIVKDKKQIVEIQFFSSTLLGLMLLLEKG